MKFDASALLISNKSALVTCTVCKKPNVASVTMKRYEAIKELHTVTYTLKLDPDKEVKLFGDEHVILLLMDSLKSRELLSAGFIEAFEFIRSDLITKTAVKLEEVG